MYFKLFYNILSGMNGAVVSLTDKRPAIALGSLTSVAFMCIGFYYSINDVISDIYMIDGIVQILFLLAWVHFVVAHWEIIATEHQKKRGSRPLE